MIAIKLLVLAGLIVVVAPCSCPPGTFLAAPPCQCTPCPNNTFMNTINNASECRPCTTCQRPKVVIRQCTKVEDVSCGCPSGQYFHSGLIFCLDCDHCLEGFGSEVKCSSESNTVCEPCIPGETFSRKKTMSPCDNCSKCVPGFTVKHNCNATRDTICELVVHNTTTQTTFTRETVSTTTNKSSFNSNPQQKDFLVPSLVVVVLLIVIILSAMAMCIFYKYRKRRRGLEQPINNDLEECEVIRLEAKPPAVPTRHSGLRGRHTRQPRRTDTRRKPVDSDGNAESEQPLLNSDQLLRDIPYATVEKLALKLNPKGLNNWVRLAGQLNYSKEKVDYFGMDPENATQRLLSDWQTSNASTIGLLHQHLKRIDRDDAAEVLETFA